MAMSRGLWPEADGNAEVDGFRQKGGMGSGLFCLKQDFLKI